MDIDFSSYYELLNTSFWDFFENRSRVRISFGGAGSGKSFSMFQEIIYKALAEPGHNYLICRKVANTNKTSTYALFKQQINIMNLTKVFKENKTEMTFTAKATGYMISFKGLDDIEKIKSFTFPKGILTDIVIEEASEITKEDFDQLNIRLRGERTGEQVNISFQITMLLNPISDQHWIKREFFDLQSYQREKILENGRVISGLKTYILHTTYLDNLFIDDDYKAILEGYKEIDYEFYKIYCLGQWGSIGNLVFKNWIVQECPYKEEDFDAIYVGMDFGYNHPQVIEKVGFKDGCLYSYNELCIREKTNKEFIEFNEDLDVLQKNEKCTADSAEPSKIKEWQQNGYSVIGAVKGKDSVSRGIDYLKSLTWYIDPVKCPRLLQEVQVFHWKEDKDGKITDQPVEIMDDALASVRYSLESLSRLKGPPSIISGEKSESKKKILEVKKAERKNLREIMKVQMKRVREERKKNLDKK